MVGDVVGQYRLVRKIGEGGMGAVYLGEHVLIGRHAAIKLLLREMSVRQELVTRFFNEARAATAVRHPGIVEIYDFGYHSDGSAYIVMEYLEGESLAARLARTGRQPVERAMVLARQIAGALAAAHAKGIVHRDLKPDNIFVVRDPDIVDAERTKVLDFGIAKLAGEQAGMAKTRTGTVLGTPAYMSPEQSKGAGNVDARTDLYALGCILFEMLCGRPPFVAEGGGEVMAQHIYVPVPMPSSLAPVPPELEQLLLRALAKDPAQRFQSADEMAMALRGTGIGSAPGPSGSHVAPYASYPPMSTAAKTTLSAASAMTSPTRAGRRRAWLVPAIAALLVGAGIAAVQLRGTSTAGEAAAKSVEPAGAPAAATSSSSVAAPTPVAPTPAAPAPAAPTQSAPTPAAPTPAVPTPVAPTPVAPTPVAPTPAAPAPAAPTQSAPTPAAPAPAAPTQSAPTPAAPAPASPAPAAHGSTAASSSNATAPGGAQVTLKLASDPSGADVYRLPEGVRLGITPLTYAMAPAEGKLVLAIRKRGYVDEQLALPRNRDTERAVTLSRAAAARPHDEKPPGNRPAAPAARPGSGAEPGSTTLDPFDKLPSNPGRH